MKPATHQGHCQWCGRPQMLPEGKLAKHGYTVRWGFFSGTCNGSDQLPFEVDISLIEGAISWAKGRAVEVADEAKTLRANSKPAFVYVNEYMGSNNRDGARYIRREIAVGDMTKGPYGEFSWPAMKGNESNDAKRTGRCKTTVYAKDGGHPDSVLKAAIQLNGEYAKTLDKTVAELLDYAVWQQGRIKGWKPHPEKLIPVEPKRKGPLVHWRGGYFKVGCAASAYGAQKIWNTTTDLSKVTCVKCTARHADFVKRMETLDPAARATFISKYMSAE